jgi:hypothetical protein
MLSTDHVTLPFRDDEARHTRRVRALVGEAFHGFIEVFDSDGAKVSGSRNSVSEEPMTQNVKIIGCCQSVRDCGRASLGCGQLSVSSRSC